ncbi:MAG: T9SS type A sorting domain-containing protein [Saprospiraceae bacterium]|nr:T9SS type A sorting domain-containing protein [Saprospiraceae bacterium]
MKHILLLALLLSAAPVFTQITITNGNFPQVGDTLRIAVDNLPSNIPITAGGADLRWDFTTLQSPFTQQIAVRPASEGEQSFEFSNATLFTPLVASGEAYYRSTSTAYQMVGLYGEDPFNFGIRVPVRFNPAKVERRAPMRYGDNKQSSSAFAFAFSSDDLPDAILDQLPITPDSMRIRIASERHDVVDAWGKLTIPGNIYNVLREKRTEIREVRLDAKIGFLGWQDITNLIPNSDLVRKDTTVSYHFFSNEAKEPIAVVTMDKQEQKALRVEYKANDLVTDVQDVQALKPGVYAFPNPAIVTVRFEFSNLNPGNYKLTIYNILGTEVWSDRYYINGQRIEKVDISMLRKGTYLYSLQDERGKTITTKRLVVVRP